MNINPKLSGWIFAFSLSENNWRAVKNDKAASPFNANKEDIIKADTFETLREIILLTGGDKDKLNKLH